MSAPAVSAILEREERGGVYSDREIERAQATVRAALGDECLMRFAVYLEALARERAHGALEVSFNMHAGHVGSADFNRRAHWQARRRQKPDPAA